MQVQMPALSLLLVCPEGSLIFLVRKISVCAWYSDELHLAVSKVILLPAGCALVWEDKCFLFFPPPPSVCCI